jgi:hypothetical protein
VKRPSEVSGDGTDGPARILRYIMERAIGSHGEVTPDAASLLALRRQGPREDELRRLLVALCPEEANSDIWQKWFSGGEPPPEMPKLKRVGTPDLSSGKTMVRSSDRVEAKARDVENLERRLAEARTSLSQAREFDAAMVQWVVSEHLSSIMAPMFAMGPAWAVMRVISAYVSPESMEVETALIRDPKKRKMIEDSVRRTRSEGTQRINDSLDLWSGHEEYERALREAIEGVVSSFEGREQERVAQGVRARSRDDVRRSVRPDTATDKAGVLGGMKPEPD